MPTAARLRKSRSTVSMMTVLIPHELDDLVRIGEQPGQIDELRGVVLEHRHRRFAKGIVQEQRRTGRTSRISGVNVTVMPILLTIVVIGRRPSA